MERRRLSRPQRVLLVDDAGDLREMWTLWLTFWGFAVEEAQNGAVAVEKARARPPDLILMDLAMPVLDGRAAMQVLAHDPETTHVPVLPMSAQISALPNEPRPTDPFLLKPSEPERLLQHIRAVLRHGAVTRAESKAVNTAR